MPDGDGRSHARRAIDHRGGQELALRAARQRGVVSREQLSELGFSRGQVERLIRDGWLQSVHHNVYAVGHRHLSDRAHLLAALLSVGAPSFLSHRTAAAVWGLRAINTHDIEITVPGTGGRRRDGLRLHRTQDEPHPDDVRNHVDLRVSSVPRLLIELAPHETPAELARLVTLAVRRRLLRPDARDGRLTLEEVLARHRRWPGMAKLAAVLAAYRRTEDHKSQLELAFDRLLAQHPDIPPPQRNIHIDHWEIDRFWPVRRLAVELDGRPYHVAVNDMERDRIKDAALQKVGVIPLRITDFRFAHDVPGILTDLRHFLKLA
ncbi:MAG: type IV toxin-antitoxin system AbiEi family antitoxin domain-containing protein [Solirubrobacteraceae bacterium]